jgi:low affinity Fe/Cu permease
MKKQKHSFRRSFERISTKITKATGSSTAFLVAGLMIVVWAVTGPLFDFSDTWQLVINTTTTIITFLMVFIIQQSQNKDTIALQLKLNELIAASKGASNRLIDIEDLTEEELFALKKFYVRLSKLAEKDNDVFSTHSIEEASAWHSSKMQARQRKPKQAGKKKSTSVPE